MSNHFKLKDIAVCIGLMDPVRKRIAEEVRQATDQPPALQTWDRFVILHAIECQNLKAPNYEAFPATAMDDRFNTPWRKMAVTTFSAPREPNIYGLYEMDVTEAMAYIRAEREAGNRITLAHLMAVVIARAIAFYAPEMQCFIRRGKLVKRPTLDLTLTIGLRNLDVAGMPLRNMAEKTVNEVAEEMRAQVGRLRSDAGQRTLKRQFALVRIPWPFRRFVFRFLRWLSQDLGLGLKTFGLSENRFGTVVISDISRFNLSFGLPAIFPGAQQTGVIVLGKPQQKPVVVDQEIVIRDLLPVSVTFDHRLIDASHLGRFHSASARYLRDPAALNRPPEKS